MMMTFHSQFIPQRQPNPLSMQANSSLDVLAHTVPCPRTPDKTHRILNVSVHTGPCLYTPDSCTTFLCLSAALSPHAQTHLTSPHRIPSGDRMELSDGIETPDRSPAWSRGTSRKASSWCIARTLTFEIIAVVPGESCAASSAIVYLKPLASRLRNEGGGKPYTGQPLHHAPPALPLRGLSALALTSLVGPLVAQALEGGAGRAQDDMGKCGGHG
jgi:hypothetical protein